MRPQKEFQRLCARRANELKKELADSLYQLRKKDYLTLQNMFSKTSGMLSIKKLEQYELGRAGGLMPMETVVIIATAVGRRVRIVFEKEGE